MVSVVGTPGIPINSASDVAQSTLDVDVSAIARVLSKTYCIIRMYTNRITIPRRKSDTGSKQICTVHTSVTIRGRQVNMWKIHTLATVGKEKCDSRFRSHRIPVRLPRASWEKKTQA